MTLNIISTQNGTHNEGMRNIATHITSCIAADGANRIRLSPLSSPLVCLKNSIGADAAVIFARGTDKTAVLAKYVRMICRNVYFVLVQPPEKRFAEVLGDAVRRIRYFAITPADGHEIAALGGEVYPRSVGIDTDKFSPPADRSEILRLREKYSVSSELPLVIHVGHISSGRGLEAFLRLPADRFERLIVASGMFPSEDVRSSLEAGGVKIITGYLEHIEEVYRMADVYLFPTVDQNFVISVPLSVMESLSCGTPAICFRGIEGLSSIVAAAGSLTVIDGSADLESAANLAALAKSYASHLTSPASWEACADEMLGVIAKEVRKR